MPFHSASFAARGLSTTSDALGEYIFPAVPSGAYTLKVTSVGFTSTTKTITVAAGQTLHADLTLAVASSDEQVVVESSCLILGEEAAFKGGSRHGLVLGPVAIAEV